MTPRIAFTPGEPAGIGPELAVKLACSDRPNPISLAQIVAIADPDLLRQEATRQGKSLRLIPFDANKPAEVTPANSLHIQAVALAQATQPGRLNPANGAYVLEALRIAAEGCKDRTFDAVVTGPVHKGVINDAGVPFSGHTEFFAENAGVKKVVMMLAADDLRVALATTHLPLKDVSAAISGESLQQVLTILHRSLRDQFRIESPRIGVCGLNPHAGEGGHLGREEIDTIEPALDTLRALGLNLIGPLPADTLFTPPQLARCDAVLAMYHDQGLPVLKFKGFGRAINITLGLPYIRTSVDHGTALNIAGQGIADTGSLLAAMHQAIELVQLRQI
ncbi:4-hydroxythreonine-4-phosphate dehydrogenase PdxA [Microbulbifer sp. HZ11]|uniref:4-hydroxythreonine-4-phosphate dehydrogenase PdxA n=1 Tax=unclassified Microbulbifer TaxID=2619833 RepID=UPI0005B9B976|nr:4-hydroxythreonine-4-phosphate dehydrogenase PdxA [Microbulbifer sp. HZ11]